MPSDDFSPKFDPETGEIIAPDPYDPNPPVAPAAAEVDPDHPPPPATSEAMAGQIDETSFLGVRTTGPYAGMLLANNLTDDGLADAVQAGTLIPSSPVEQMFPDNPPPVDPPVEPAPIPVISGLSPSSASFSVTELTLDIMGSNFAEGDRVFSDDLEATAVSVVDASHITAFFSAISVGSPRDTEITVQNAEGDGSNAYTFTYHADEEPPPEDTTGGAA